MSKSGLSNLYMIIALTHVYSVYTSSQTTPTAILLMRNLSVTAVRKQISVQIKSCMTYITYMYRINTMLIQRKLTMTSVMFSELCSTY